MKIKYNVYSFRKYVEKLVKEKRIKATFCDKCNGMGIIHFKTYWFAEYCEKCNGTGYIKFEELDGSIFICPKCHAKGQYCKYCKSTGFINWVERVVRRDT